MFLCLSINFGFLLQTVNYMRKESSFFLIHHCIASNWLTDWSSLCPINISSFPNNPQGKVLKMDLNT